MALILTDGLMNIGSDIGQYRCRYNGNFIKYKSHMSQPDLGKSNHEDSIWFNSFVLEIPNVGKIQGQKGLFNISDRCGRPQKLKDGALPYLFFGRIMKEKMASRIRDRQTNWTKGGVEDSWHNKM